jgi:hypothetical protein
VLEIGRLKCAMNFFEQTKFINGKPDKPHKRINSLRYFRDEIEEAIAEAHEARLSDESPDAMLASRRRWWEMKKQGVDINKPPRERGDG